MILSTQNNLFKFKYLVDDLIKIIVPITQRVARQQKNADGLNNIEDGAIDEEDDSFIEGLIQSGSLRAYEILTFMTRDIAKPYSWKEAGTESREAIVYTLNKEDWMADNVPQLIDEWIKEVIKQYALLEWYKTNGLIEFAKLAMMDYENAKSDLRTSSRLRKTPARRPIQILP